MCQKRCCFFLCFDGSYCLHVLGGWTGEQRGFAEFMLDSRSNSARSHKDMLMEFLTQEMSLPFEMHSIHRALFMNVVKDPSKELCLNDMLQIVSMVLTKHIPPAWLAFAADCAEMHIARGGHFVEKSEQAGIY